MQNVTPLCHIPPADNMIFTRLKAPNFFFGWATSAFLDGGPLLEPEMRINKMTTMISAPNPKTYPE